MQPPTRSERSPWPWLAAAALLLQAATLAWLAVASTRIERGLERTERTAPLSEAPPPPPPAAAPSPAGPAAPSIASLGDGRLVYATADGKLVLVKTDPMTRGLAIERVYSLEKDELRYAGDDARRAYSGLYLVDVEAARREAIALQAGFFRDAVAKAAERPDGLERCIEAARKLADAGGVAELVRELQERSSFARHAAALALGERGYLSAIPDLIQIAEGSGDAELARHVVQLLRELTGIPFDRDEPRPTIVRRADEWWKKNAPADVYARRVSAPR